MKVHILFTFRNGPYGGVNQFLKALKEFIVEKGYYVDDIAEADVILFNSGHNIDEVIKYKKLYPEKVFVQRIDGPGRLYNKMSDKRDLVANTMNMTIADATVFQSQYSRDVNYKMGLKKSRYETTVINAPNSSIFYPKAERNFDFSNRKIRLIASSWSSNMNKGFVFYKFLDEHLDFDRYEMTFVGNSPVAFKNIRHIEPLNSNDLAEELRSNDIYITGSKKDPCSNALIEALFCGLPAVALRDGGHPEIVGKAGELFEREEEIIPCIQKIQEDYEHYVQQILLSDMNEVGLKYIHFFETLLEQIKKDGYIPKKCTWIRLLKIKGSVLILKIYDKRDRIVKKYFKK